MHDVDGLNAGYARALLEQYLENPEAVPAEWRSLFESGASELVATHPGLARLVELLREDGNGHVAAPPAPPPPESAAGSTPAPVARACRGPAPRTRRCSRASPPRWRSSRRIRTHGHLAARLDPLGSEPVGDPALEPERLEPTLTPELQREDPGLAARRARSRRDGGRRAAAPARDLQRHERVRDRAHRRPRAACLAARRDRVGPVPPTAAGRREAAPARASDRGGGLRALPPPRLPRPEAVLDRGPRRDGADARRGDRARRRGGRARGRVRDGAPGSAERPRPRARPPVRVDPARVRGRAHPGGCRRRPGGRDRRRQVPPRSGGPRPNPVGGDHPHPRLQPQPPRSRQTRSSKAGRGRSRPTARPGPATTTRRSRCRS